MINVCVQLVCVCDGVCDDVCGDGGGVYHHHVPHHGVILLEPQRT